jgi:hypothetical protein
MNANEFRIGNYVKFPDNLIHKVDMLYKDFAGLKIWQPITLTEKWLLDFGFVKTHNKWFEINYFTDCKHTEEKMGILINLVSNRCAILDTDTEQQSAMTGKRIYYVHQLQNLYFALTGEELVVSDAVS